jgi:hypothetical protein
MLSAYSVPKRCFAFDINWIDQYTGITHFRQQILHHISQSLQIPMQAVATVATAVATAATATHSCMHTT